MIADEWNKVSSILNAVLEIDPSDRPKYLDQLDLSESLRIEIESLLSNEEEAKSLMDVSAAEYVCGLSDAKQPDENSIVGMRIGIYEITSELGVGGMGAVYKAKRIDGKFDQVVALKLLRREFNSQTIRKRFKQERRIQAKLTNKRIASLIDAGTTDDGIPFLVMEYVDGIQIDKYCAKYNLGLKERLVLFNKVCDAVSYAHRNLVVHRDLKPSNILVTEEGEPKLLDFGISKLIDDEEMVTQTVTNLGVMTPQYASPEQIKHKSVTTSTDIYSLGLILFELLTGNLPFDHNPPLNGRLGQSGRDDDPQKPSVSANGTTLNSDLADGSKLKPVLADQLKGDLDNVILKALNKEPDRRYQSVDRFADDVWRFVDGQPVSARPATFSYRAAKFYLRNKITVLASFVTLFALLFGTGLAIWQARVAREQARMAIEAHHEAEQEAEKAKKITEFMAKLISFANPRVDAAGAAEKGETRMIDVIERTRTKIESEFPGQLDIQSELHHKYAEVYQSISSVLEDDGFRSEDALEKAGFHAKRALELRRKHYGENHELVAKDLFYLWASAPDQKHHPEHLIKAILIMRELDPQNANYPHMLTGYGYRLSDDTSPEIMRLYYQNVPAGMRIGKYELAERFQREALERFSEDESGNASNIAMTHCYIAHILIQGPQRSDFEEHYSACKTAANNPALAAKKSGFESMIKRIASLQERQ